MTTITTRSGKGSPLTNDEVDANFTGLNTDKVETSGDSMTGDLSFGDNVKATFGSDDLQIYHEPNHSIINESGTGSLKIQGDNIRLQKTDGSENMITAVNDGAVTLFYDNSAKFETTNTGIDVTGTVTADALDIDNLKILSGQSTTPTNLASPLIYKTTSHSDYGNGDLIIQARSSASRAIYMLTGTTTPVNRLRVGGNGDISFYDSSGTSQSLLWDASAESLGIGTSSPTGKIGIYGGSINDIPLVITHAWGSSSTALISASNSSSEVFKVERSGNLLVGTTETDVGYTDSGAGCMLAPEGTLQLARSSSNANLYLNKLDNDGEIINFRKDGTTVGSIATVSSRIAIGKGDVGLFLDNVNDRFTPIHQDNLVDRDAAIDLGYASSRFKDLYLSGGVYLGGTGSANHLDDYEEGTWTPALSSTANAPTTSAFSATYATYTKVGRKVYVQAYVTATFSDIGTGIATITGLPFTPTGYSTASFKHCDMLLCNGGYFQHGNPRIVAITDNTTSGVAYNGTGTSRAIMLSGTYETNE